MKKMKFKTGDRVVHAIHGVGTVQIVGVNGWCRIVFDNGTIAIVKTSELAKLIQLPKA